MMELTKERLQQIVHAAGLEPCDYEEVFDGITTGEIVTMARQLLSGIEQEPVAWRWFHLKQWHVTNDEARARGLAWDGVNVTPLYAAPQLPQPAVVSNASREDFETWARGAGFNENWYFFTNTHPNHYDDDHINDMWAAWNACRDDMLQGAEPVSQPYTLGDGWVAVPVELTGDMTNAMTDAILDDLHNVDVWRSVLAAAPQQEVK